MKLLYSFLVPGGLLLLAGVVFLHWAAAPESLSVLVRVYPYAVFGAGFLLGWRFHRSRIVFALLVLVLADRGLLQFAAGEAAAAGAGRVVFQVVAFLVPLNLVAFSWMRERALLSRAGLWRLSLILVQVAAVAWLARLGQADVAALLEHNFLAPGFFGWSAIGQPALAVFGAAFVLFMLRFLRQRGALESGFLWGLVAVLLALTNGQGGVRSTFYLATGGLILVMAVIETSYRMAYRDELTGLGARRALNEALAQVGSRYAIAMVDIDHFKKFNDQHGHDVGDQLLRMVGAKLAEVAGGAEAFRYGGEEFAVIFPDKSVEEAFPHLEELRKTVAATRFGVRGRDRPRKKPEKPRPSCGPRKQVSVTISLGVAERDDRHSEAEHVIQAADKALYRAKKAGRNQVKA
ncbi:MAG: diguanylate cyclase [Terriglobia bacterium]